MFNQKEKVEKVGTFFRFEDLRIYHKSINYINWLQDVTMQFPGNDQSQFVLRFCDSGRNIAFFIAEGSARNKSQFIYYLKLAKSSIRECLVFTTLSLNQNNITETQDQESRQQLMEMTKMIGALISSLQRANLSNGNGNTSNGNTNGNTNSNTNGNSRYSGKGSHNDDSKSRYESNGNEEFNNEFEN